MDYYFGDYTILIRGRTSSKSWTLLTATASSLLLLLLDLLLNQEESAFHCSLTTLDSDNPVGGARMVDSSLAHLHISSTVLFDLLHMSASWSQYSTNQTLL